jgi:NhaP-type Na+/H+ or K+/H+ antiporter
LGPLGLQIASSDLLESPKFFEHLTEAVVIITLFVAGLKLRFPLNRANWAATVSMFITIGLVAAFSFYFREFQQREKMRFGIWRLFRGFSNLKKL